MPKGTCAVDGCNLDTVAKGYCDRHYRRWKKHGDPLADHCLGGPRRCTVDGCTRPGDRPGGLCQPHHTRAERGLPMDATTRQLRGGMDETCSIDGCTEPRVSRGWCETHYGRWKAHGDPLTKLSTASKPKSGPCKIEGCTSDAVGWGYCDSHYRKYTLYGDPEHVQQKFCSWTYGDHPSGCRVMTITDTRGEQHEVLYDHGDEDIAQGYRWYINVGGYACTARGSRAGVLFMARMILGLGPGDDGVCDHANGHRRDNRRANLRVTDQKRNVENQAIVNNRGSSRYRGVHWDSARHLWVARGKTGGRNRHIGRFASEEAAAEAVRRWREQHDIWPGYGDAS